MTWQAANTTAIKGFRHISHYKTFTDRVLRNRTVHAFWWSTKYAVSGDGVQDFRRLASFGVIAFCKGHCKVSISDSILARLFVSYFRPPSPLFQVLQDDRSPCTATEIELIPILVLEILLSALSSQQSSFHFSTAELLETGAPSFFVKYLLSCILGVPAPY